MDQDNTRAWRIQLEDTCDLGYDPEEGWRQSLSAYGHGNPDWVAPRLFMWCEEDEDRWQVSPKDFVHFGSGWACNEKAQRILQPHCEPDVEFLPLLCGPETYHFLNPAAVIDALDRSRSGYFARREQPEHIIVVVKHIFIPERLQGRTLFRIPEDNAVFATQSFADLVERSGLTGIRFFRP